MCASRVSVPVSSGRLLQGAELQSYCRQIAGFLFPRMLSRPHGNCIEHHVDVYLGIGDVILLLRMLAIGHGKKLRKSLGVEASSREFVQRVIARPN